MKCRLLLNDTVRAASLHVSNTAAEMGSDLLKTDPKGEACRILSGTGSITATWSNPVTVGAVVIPACNLQSSSTIRIRAYEDSAGSVLLSDTGPVFATPGAMLENWTFTQPLNVNSFVEGAAMVAAYLPQHESVRRLDIELSDPSATFIDLSKLVIGDYIEVQYGASWGAQTSLVDLSVNSRAASGDIKTDWAPKAKRLTFSLDWVQESDRARVLSMFKGGIGRWLFADLLYGCPDPVKRQDYMIYGKLMQPGGMRYISHRLHDTTFDIEGY